MLQRAKPICFGWLAFKGRYQKRGLQSIVQETWVRCICPTRGKPIADYFVSELGKIKNQKTGREIKQHTGKFKDGYLSVRLQGKPQQVHRVVCASFNGSPPEGKVEVHHINSIRTDNRACNLMWVSKSENMNFTFENEDRVKITKPVLKVDENGEVLEKFESVKAAAESIGVYSSGISKALKVGSRCGGFKWILEDADEAYVGKECELWRPLRETVYEVSNFGNVRNYKKKRLLKIKEKQGYLKVGITIKGKSKGFLVHRLVAECFCEKPDGKEVVTHLDGNNLNNKADNLLWVT